MGLYNFKPQVELSESEREALAIRDGFKNIDDMAEFWAGRMPFSGHIIHWKSKMRNAKEIEIYV